MNERHPMGFSCDNMSNLKRFNEDFDISNPFTPGIHLKVSHILKQTCSFQWTPGIKGINKTWSPLLK